LCEVGACAAARSSWGSYQETIDQVLDLCRRELRAACIAQSRASFVSKLSIVVEEVDESCFWMEFIVDEKLLKEGQVNPLHGEGEELTSIFVSARRTIKNNK
jgi:hypothetical protein